MNSHCSRRETSEIVSRVTSASFRARKLRFTNAINFDDISGLSRHRHISIAYNILVEIHIIKYNSNTICNIVFTVSNSSSTDTCLLNVSIVPELTQRADRQFQLPITRLIKLNFLTSNLNNE